MTSRTRTWSWIVAVLVAGTAAFVAWRASVPRSGDILLITVDALRPDHLGMYGYPRPTSRNLDRWLADGAVFRNAYSAAGQTAPSVTSMLSGRLPQEHGVRLIWQLLPDETPLLPDLLPAEYQSAAFVSNMVLTDEAIGFGHRFDHYDDFVEEKERSVRPIFERTAARTTEAAIRWLRELRDPRRPLFLWVHYIDPHGPYDPPTEWPRSFDHAAPRPIDPERVSKYMRLPGVEDGLVYVDRYDEEIAFTDREIDRLLNAYAAIADWQQALAIFSSDHGESMMEHEGWFTHGYQVYEEIVRVPLVVRGPGVTAGARQGLASTLDIAPTVLRFAGATAPADLGGVDLLGSPIPGDRSVFVESAHGRPTARRQFQWRSERRGRRKWVVALNRRSGRIVETRLYDLESDPGERHPTAWSAERDPPPTLLDLCRADPDPAGVPQRYRKGVRIASPKVSDRADERAREGLRALGYLD